MWMDLRLPRCAAELEDICRGKCAKIPPKEKNKTQKALGKKVYKKHLQAVILAKGMTLGPTIQFGQTFALFTSVTLKMYKTKNKMI